MLLSREAAHFAVPRWQAWTEGKPGDLVSRPLRGIGEELTAHHDRQEQAPAGLGRTGAWCQS
jgi:hypothetical protein